jgi:hypothetical protein
LEQNPNIVVRSLAPLIATLLLTVYMASVVPLVVHAQDGEPPIVSDVHVDVIGETWFTVGWTTSEPSHGGVEWGRGDALANVAEEEPGLRMYHFMNVTGLTRGEDHQVRIFAVDESNNTGYSDIWTVGTFPIGWEDRLVLEHGWLIITVLVAVVAILAVIIIVVRGDPRG